MTIKTNTIITATIAIAILVSLIVFIYVNLPKNQTTENEEPQPETSVLTVTYNGITQNYTLDELQSIDSFTAKGGYRTSFPSIKGQGNYTGTRIKNLVHSFDQTVINYSVIITSFDGEQTENKTYNYSIILGNVDIFDPENASNATPIGQGGLTMVLAYQYEGTLLNASKDGVLKVAFLDTQGSITTAGLWWKYVVALQIIPE
jgi:hypothetical protein